MIMHTIKHFDIVAIRLKKKETEEYFLNTFTLKRGLHPDMKLLKEKYFLQVRKLITLTK